MAGGPKSSFCRELVASALAGGETVAEAAAGAHVAARTVFRWLGTDRDFQMLVQQLHREALDQATGVLVRAQVGAARRLARLARGKDQKVALAACVALLARLDGLRQRVNGRMNELRHGLEEDAPGLAAGPGLAAVRAMLGQLDVPAPVFPASTGNGAAPPPPANGRPPP
jgi:hypothetical protein